MSPATHLAVTAFLFGVAIGVSRIKAIVLVICIPALTLAAAVLVHDTFFSFVLAAGESIVALQVGYVAAIILLMLI